MRNRETLREAVEAQARALVEGDLALFASYAAPQALPAMYRAPNAGPVRRFDIVEVEAGEADGRSTVRFRGSGSYVMHGAWRFTERGWRAVALDIPDDSPRPAWWRRMLRLAPQNGPAVEREDLS